MKRARPCGVHRWYCFSIWIFPQLPSMKSYVILEVFRIEIEQINFSRFWNGTGKISGIQFFFAEVNKKFPGLADFIRLVRKGVTNNILILALTYKKIAIFS